MLNEYEAGVIYLYVNPSCFYFLSYFIIGGIVLEKKRQVRELLSPIAEEMDLYITGIEFSSDRRGMLVRLFVDGDFEKGVYGINLDRCAKFSREISPILDVENPFDGAYTLEISSPGTDRLLEVPKDFKRFEGFSVRIKPKNRKSKVDGILRESDQNGFQIEIPSLQKVQKKQQETRTTEQEVVEDSIDTTPNIEDCMRDFQYDDVNWIRLHPTDEEFDKLAKLVRPPAT
jgi:ribosome maturation factor RimP